MENLSQSLFAPLVGLGTTAAAYLGWVLLHRLLPPPFNSMGRLWLLASVALGVLGYWMVPCEGRFAAPEVQAWQSRQITLASQPEWREMSEVWRQMSGLSPSAASTSARLDEIGDRLVAAMAGLGALQERGLLTEADLRALGSLALNRHAYLRAWAARPGDHDQSPWQSGMGALETRLRFLNLVLDVPESQHLLWQQRVRMSRELATLERLASSQDGAAELVKAGGPDFRSVAPHLRDLALLVVDLSVSREVPAAACGTPGETCNTQQQAACQSSGMGSCGTEKPAAAAGGCCGR